MAEEALLHGQPGRRERKVLDLNVLFKGMLQ
jgi:hypothetical protein